MPYIMSSVKGFFVFFLKGISAGAVAGNWRLKKGVEGGKCIDLLLRHINVLFQALVQITQIRPSEREERLQFSILKIVCNFII